MFFFFQKTSSLCHHQDARCTYLVPLSGISTKSNELSTWQMVLCDRQHHYTRMTGTILHSLLHGDATDIALLLKAILLLVMGTPGDVMEITSSIPNKAKCIYDTLLWSNTIKNSFFQAANGLDTLLKTKLNLQVLKSQVTLYDHARGISRTSWNSQLHRT